MGLWLVILAGSPALYSGIILAIFSLSGKISLSKDMSNKYLSGMFGSLKQFLITLKLISPHPGLLFILSEKMPLWPR